MSRSIIFSKPMIISSVVLLAAAVAGGAVIFEDNFESAESAPNWVKSSGAPDLTFDGGTAVLNNTTGYMAAYTRVFSEKPSAFTLTFELKELSKKGEAGVMFCKQGPDNFNGYLLTIGRDKDDRVDLVTVHKVTETVSGNMINVSWSHIFYAESPDLKASNNKFAVSKNGSNFNVFVNDVFLDKFTDASYTSGDIALIANDGVSAKFGPVNMTDQSTSGQHRYAFTDDFGADALHSYWTTLSSDGGTPNTSVVGGALTVTNNASTLTVMYVDLPGLDNGAFEASVDVQHIGGGTTNNDFYGIILRGSDGKTAYFAITGGQRYTIWSPRDGNNIPDPQFNEAIKGSPGAAQVVNIDKLVVKKKSGASAYEFSVNGTNVSVNYALVDFAITGIGIFAYPGVTVQFDNFSAGSESGSTSIMPNRNPRQSVRGSSAAKTPNNVFYDLRGRKRYTAVPAASGKVPRRSAGVYVNENGRDVVVRKGRVGGRK